MVYISAGRLFGATDVVWTPPNTKHWHGAAPASAMTHAAVTESANEKSVEWLEKVTDDQYKIPAK